jgi:hypothetical protein
MHRACIGGSVCSGIGPSGPRLFKGMKSHAKVHTDTGAEAVVPVAGNLRPLRVLSERISLRRVLGAFEFSVAIVDS